jgi:PAS domain-containing protein
MAEIISFDIVILFMIFFVQSHIQSVLLILLHFEPELVFQSPNIMKIINGDFSQHEGEKSNLRERFYQDVVDFLPDTIIITDIMHNIKYVNKSFERIFEVDETNAGTMTLQHTFEKTNFSYDLSQLLSPNK